MANGHRVNCRDVLGRDRHALVYFEPSAVRVVAPPGEQFVIDQLAAARLSTLLLTVAWGDTRQVVDRSGNARRG